MKMNIFLEAIIYMLLSTNKTFITIIIILYKIMVNLYKINNKTNSSYILKINNYNNNSQIR
jgi:hypothetical protein